MGNGEWGMGNGEWGMGNGEWGMGKEVIFISLCPLTLALYPLPPALSPKRLQFVFPLQSNQSGNFQLRDLIAFGHKCYQGLDALFSRHLR